MYRAQYAQRYTLGKQSESDILPILKDYFKREITPTEGQYNEFDFKDETYNYELKTRTNKMTQYPTTMTTLNKCKPNSILLFKYTDQLAFIEYDQERFKNYEVFQYTRYEDKCKRDHILIPIQDLTIICS
jgi:hypothetical protein